MSDPSISKIIRKEMKRAFRKYGGSVRISKKEKRNAGKRSAWQQFMSDNSKRIREEIKTKNNGIIPEGAVMSALKDQYAKWKQSSQNQSPPSKTSPPRGTGNNGSKKQEESSESSGEE